MDEGDLVTLNLYQSMIQHANHAAAGRARRTRMNVLAVLDETQQDNIRLIKVEQTLRAENQLLVNVLKTLVERCETYRRVSLHLLKAWNPSDPAEVALKEDGAPLWDQKLAELRAEAGWPEERERAAAEWVARSRPKKK